MNSEEIKKQITDVAKEIGFDLVRIAPARLPQKYLDKFGSWIESGQHGSMEYLAKRIQNKITPEILLPGVKSVIVLGTNYYFPDTREGKAHEGYVSRYALTRDYHKTLKKKLKRLCATISEQFSAGTKAYVDTGPILEKAYAETSGLGYIGKNSCLISEDFGSWIFLSEVLTTLELPADGKQTKLRCGACKRCIVQCPTGAINADFTIDARKCISYLTIENKGPIPVELREKVGHWLFGCDICQEVCPHNSRQIPAKLLDYTEIRIKDRLLSLEQILSINNEKDFLDCFSGTPIMRAKWRGMVRNACVVAGNSGQVKLIPILKKIVGYRDSMLAEHAEWAINKLRCWSDGVME